MSILIGVLVLASAWSILRDSTEILLESTPRGIDAGRSGGASHRRPGVVEVHDLHVWTITSGFPGALRARPRPARARTATAGAASSSGSYTIEFGIEHTTLQVDHATDAGLVEIGRFGD